MTTARFALPLLSAGQAQKEMFHNEAITRIDALLHPSVKGVAAVPPTAPDPGEAWIVAPDAEGDWVGATGQLASWTENGWRFAAPREGMATWSENLLQTVRYIGGAWQSGVLAGARVEIGGVQVIGNRTPAIAGPSGGTTVDDEARAAVNAILDALRAHGLIASAEL